MQHIEQVVIFVDCPVMAGLDALHTSPVKVFPYDSGVYSIIL